eukprot:COSAG06_NODE_56352_length_285_cov_0.822581_1_plen_25_part_01
MVNYYAIRSNERLLRMHINGNALLG